VPAARAAIVIHRPFPEQITAQRLEPGVFEIVGRSAERAIGLSDLTDDQDTRRGARTAAPPRRRPGSPRVPVAHDGDEVRIGELSFTWYRYGPDSSLEPGAPQDEGARPRRGKGSK
jgi:hypothetical protein